MFLKTDGAGNLSFSSDLPTTSFTGATVETSIAGGDLVLVYDDSATAVRKMTRTNFVAGVGGANTPAFEASLSANQNVSDATDTKANCNTENFDTDNCYDNATNYRFTPTTAGKYFVYGQIATNNNTVYLQHTQSIIKKNGATVKFSRIYDSSGFNLSNFIPVVAVVNMNGTTDYLELFGFNDSSGGQNIFELTHTYFGAYRLIGV